MNIPDSDLSIAEKKHEIYYSYKTPAFGSLFFSIILIILLLWNPVTFLIHPDNFSLKTLEIGGCIAGVLLIFITSSVLSALKSLSLENFFKISFIVFFSVVYFPFLFPLQCLGPFNRNSLLEIIYFISCFYLPLLCYRVGEYRNIFRFVYSGIILYYLFSKLNFSNGTYLNLEKSFNVYIIGLISITIISALIEFIRYDFSSLKVYLIHLLLLCSFLIQSILFAEYPEVQQKLISSAPTGQNTQPANQKIQSTNRESSLSSIKKKILLIIPSDSEKKFSLFNHQIEVYTRKKVNSEVIFKELFIPGTKDKYISIAMKNYKKFPEPVVFSFSEPANLNFSTELEGKMNSLTGFSRGQKPFPVYYEIQQAGFLRISFSKSD